jgi:hypothetical protein
LDVGQVVQRELKLLHRFCNQLLGLRQLVGVIELLIAEPFEAVELVMALLYLTECEAPPTTIWRITLPAFAASMGSLP